MGKGYVSLENNFATLDKVIEYVANGNPLHFHWIQKVCRESSVQGMA
jgi:hypothetical protein